MNTRTIFSGTVMLAVLAAVAVRAPAQERGQGQPKPTTKALIEQLGHQDYAQREAAEKRLLVHGKAARAQLERAAKDHDDAEVRWRAQRILRGLDRGEAGERPDTRGGLRRRQPGDRQQRRIDRSRQGLDRIEDVDRLFDEIFGRLERELGIDIKDVRRHLERARSDGRDRDTQFDKQSKSMKMSIGTPFSTTSLATLANFFTSCS